MDPVTVSGLFSLGESLVSRIWPDPKDQAVEMRKLEELKQKGDLAQLQAQVDLLMQQAKINLADAKSGSKFQAWWRPAIGWVGAVSLFLMYVPKAIMMTYMWSYQAFTILDKWNGTGNLILPDFPDLGVSDIIGLLMSMLGIAGMRSFDKLKGTDSKK